MKVFRFSVILLCFILSSCGFDIHGGIFKAKPDVPVEQHDRVYWEDYSVKASYAQEEACLLFYFKRNLACGQCDLMDKTFKNQEVVHILNNYFINYKGTDDLPAGEKYLNDWEEDAPPIVYIYSGGSAPRAILYSDTWAIPPRAFIRILNDAVRKCKDHRDGKEARK